MDEEQPASEELTDPLEPPAEEEPTDLPELPAETEPSDLLDIPVEGISTNPPESALEATDEPTMESVAID